MVVLNPMGYWTLYRRHCAYVRDENIISHRKMVSYEVLKIGCW